MRTNPNPERWISKRCLAGVRTTGPEKRFPKLGSKRAEGIRIRVTRVRVDGHDFPSFHGSVAIME